MAKVRVNGKGTEVDPNTTIGELVQTLALDERFLVVEHNGLPLRFADARQVVLRDGDRLELVRPVAGG